MKIVLALIATPFRIFVGHQEVCVTTAVSQLATIGVAAFFLAPVIFVSELGNFSFFWATVVLSFSLILTYPFSNICLFAESKKIDIIHVYWIYSWNHLFIFLIFGLLLGVSLSSILMLRDYTSGAFLGAAMFFVFNLVHSLSFFYLESSGRNFKSTSRLVLRVLPQIIALQVIQCLIYGFVLLFCALPLLLGWIYAIPTLFFSNFILFKFVLGDLTSWEQDLNRYSSIDVSIVERGKIAAEKRAEEEKIAAEKRAEEERIAAEKRLEEERIAAEKRAEEIAAEKRLEEERIAAEKRAEEERIAAEERVEEERIAAEKRAEEKRKAEEKPAEEEKKS